MDDLDLLQRYLQEGSQDAFAAVFRRHVNLVYCAALRQVRSPDLASDVTQRVFLDLAASVGKLRPNTHLASWLYVVTRRVAVDTIRREISRQRREQAAAEAATVNSPPSLWPALSSYLDEAMAELPERDRATILLRFFERKSQAEIARLFSTTENAAQKRITRALHRLQVLLAKRGVVATAAGLASEIPLRAVEAAPRAVVAQVVSTFQELLVSLPPPVLPGVHGLVTPLLQKALVGLGTAAVAIGLFYQANLIRARQPQVALLEAAVAELEHQAASARAKSESARRNSTTGPSAVFPPDPQLDARLQALLARAAKLKQRLLQDPAQQIPELRYLDQDAWIGVAQQYVRLESDADFAAAFSTARTWAKQAFGRLLRDALKAFVAANQGRLPTEVVELAPYFEPPVEISLLQRYETRSTGWAKDVHRDTIVIGEKENLLADPQRDNVLLVKLEGLAVGTARRDPRPRVDGKPVELTDLPPGFAAFVQALDAASAAYRADHGGRMPKNAEQLRPYFSEAEIAELSLSDITIEETFSSNPLFVLDPEGLSSPQAMNDALQLFRAAHHGAHSASALELALYFQDPMDAAKYLIAAQEKSSKN